MIDREDVIRWAREAWFGNGPELAHVPVELERFAQTAYAAGAAAERDKYEQRLKFIAERWEAECQSQVEIEREACAKVCEDKGLVWKSRHNINPDNAEKAYMASQFIASAIRARKDNT